MSKNRDEMILRALAKLGHNNSGQSVSEEDKSRVEDALEPVFAELGALEIYYVADYGHYEDEVFEPLAEYLAAAMCEDFGGDRVAWDARRTDAMNRLKRINAPRGTGQPLRTDPMLRAGASRRGTALINGC